MLFNVNGQSILSCSYTESIRPNINSCLQTIHPLNQDGMLSHCQTMGERGMGGGPDNIFLSHQCISQRAVGTLCPRGPIASRWGSVPVFLRKPIITSDFPEGGGGGVGGDQNPLFPIWICPCYV